TRSKRDWSSDVCSSDLFQLDGALEHATGRGLGLSVGKVLVQLVDEAVDVVGGHRFPIHGMLHAGQLNGRQWIGNGVFLRKLCIEIRRASCRGRTWTSQC